MPRLSFPENAIDTETLFKKERTELLALLPEEERAQIDESVDHQAIFGSVLTSLLAGLDNSTLGKIAEIHWADETGLRSDDVRGRSYALRTYP